jgi:3-oxoacyl-[acyl-carrier-protein] synthase-3
MLLMRTTGVVSRRVAVRGTTTSDLCIAAAERLLNDLKWTASEIDLIVFVSQSRDYPIPSTSAIIQDRMNFSKSCVAYDINMGCSGYVYGLWNAAANMRACGLKRALVMVGDISTAHISYKDKSAYPLFGDAGTATALELDTQAPSLYFNLQTDGSGFDAIIIHDGGMKHMATKRSFDYHKISDGIYRTKVQLALDGIKVFNFALREVSPNIRDLLAFAGKNIEDVNYCLLHQANLLINETIRKKLKLMPEQTPHSLDAYGNTSSASIPLTMVTRIREQISGGKLNHVLSGFGVGLSWGSIWLETDRITCPELIEF